MQATVVRTEDGRVDVRVRRGYRLERLDRLHFDLRVGDAIEVKRVPNNPYLVRKPEPQT